jgi:predicted acyltransferase
MAEGYQPTLELSTLGKPNAVPRPPGRVASVDALRGLTILLMVFVNDLGRAAPAWMHHIQPPSADGMTLADVVFPVFLFLVGVSIALAFERVQTAGTSPAAQLGHVVTRTVSLLLMGLVELNSADDHTLGRPLWRLLAYTALILAWWAPPAERRRKRTLVFLAKGLGGASLLVLLVLYRRGPVASELPWWGPVDNWVWLRTGWWGILGLIGWAYLTVGVLVLLLGWRREWLMGALALLLVLHLAINHGGLFTRLHDKPWLGAAAAPLKALAGAVDDVSHYVSLRDATGSLAAVTMAGCLLGTILRRDSDLNTQRARIRWAGTFAVGLFLAGCLTDTFEGINKIAATPTWCLWSAALATVAWIGLALVCDGPNAGAWSLPVRAAGANPLVAYLLHPVLVDGIALAGLSESLLAYKQAADPWVVVGGSMGMAALVCALAGLLGRWGLRMRL